MLCPRTLARPSPVHCFLLVIQAQLRFHLRPLPRAKDPDLPSRNLVLPALCRQLSRCLNRPAPSVHSFAPRIRISMFCRQLQDTWFFPRQADRGQSPKRKSESQKPQISEIRTVYVNLQACDTINNIPARPLPPRCPRRCPMSHALNISTKFIPSLWPFLSVLISISHNSPVLYSFSLPVLYT
ncbi:hypothetical protein DFH07DRAFT_863582 [Mycena maculata]|uniref:Uncharacterized protein n=1 Tax=Mycena maculata TaxID=230809 RepID=A0AAD7MFH1_9AGAR|nr:hypothetical protein DFH07DRAFT_863582 [Mycena maculata]